MGETESGALPLDIDELSVWVKSFGEHFKFTGGIFANTDGVADYTDDIDNFGMGVFYDASEGDSGVYAEPHAMMTGTALVNGFLAEMTFVPVTGQLLLAPNLNNKATGDYATGQATVRGTVQCVRREDGTYLGIGMSRRFVPRPPEGAEEYVFLPVACGAERG
jgi:hypothetical protein